MEEGRRGDWGQASAKWRGLHGQKLTCRKEIWDICSLCYPATLQLPSLLQTYLLISFLINTITRAPGVYPVELNLILHMQLDSPFKLTPSLVKDRLYRIIDHHFQWLDNLQKQSSNKALVLNEALLEQWYDLLIKMVYFRDQKEVPVGPVKITGLHQSHHDIQNLKCIPPLKRGETEERNLLLSVAANRVELFQIKQQDKDKFVSWNSKLQFKKGLVHRFCSHSVCSHDNVVLIGGCRASDPHLKSHQILSLNLVSKQVAKIGELPFGVSSHGAVRVGECIYIVGGNRNFNMVTRKCCKFDLISKVAEPIAGLNYPSASHALLDWKQKFIYKFGGIGSCFEEWDLSPYIERYSIKEDFWQVINPTIRINQNLLHYYSLLANSLVYVSHRQSIVVMGGFDFQKRPSNKVFEIEVKQHIHNGQIEYQHDIVNLGKLQQLKPGGFLSQHTTLKDGHLLALETIHNQQKGLTCLVASISNNVTYL